MAQEMANRAVTGNPQHVRLFLDWYMPAVESHLAANPQLDPGKTSALDFTDDELAAIVRDGLKETKSAP